MLLVLRIKFTLSLLVFCFHVFVCSRFLFESFSAHIICAYLLEALAHVHSVFALVNRRVSWFCVRKKKCEQNHGQEKKTERLHVAS